MKTILLTIAILLLKFASFSQMNVDYQTHTPAQLVDSLASGQTCSAITFDNYKGTNRQCGYFTDPSGSLGFTEGIVLSTGHADRLIDDPNTQQNQDVATTGDAELNTISPGTQNTEDACIIEFDFIPQTNQISFNYIFLSEEYPEYICSDFNDVFAFIISGPGIANDPGITGKNIALIPGKTIPVSINTINNGIVGAAAVDNAPCVNADPDWLSNTQYFVPNYPPTINNNSISLGGYTTPLTAVADVIPCETYHLKLAIADVGDGIYDSDVIIEAHSLVIGNGVTTSSTSFSGNATEVYEGCESNFVFTLDQTDTVDINIDYTVSGTAISGTDYDNFSGSISIPAGQIADTLPINAILDGIPEGTETITLTTSSGCVCDPTPIVYTINVFNVDPLIVEAGDDVTICQGENVNLSALAQNGHGNYTYSWDNGAGNGANVNVSPSVTTTYTVSVTDTCGNFATDNVTVNVINPPDVDDLADVNECDNYTLPAITGTNLTGNEAYYTGPNGTGTIYSEGDIITSNTTLFIYDGVPSCSDQESFTISLDVTPPTMTCPNDLTAVCSISEQPAYASFSEFTGAGGTAADDVSLNTSSFTLLSEVSDNNSCPETIVRTYQIADACGHTQTCQQTIIVNDLISPTGSAPGDITVECPTDVPAANPLLITDEADNCTANPTVEFVSDVSNGNTCPEIITRTYSITDDCGNSIDVVQTITINDVTAPTGSAPADVMVECSADVPAADPLQIIDETDNCTPNPVVEFVSDVSDGNTCPEVITRTYSITDDCGNSINVVQTITVNDVTPPTATAPANVTVECPGDVPAADPLQITDEADNCTANPTVEFVSDVSDGNTCPEVITRTYSITDDCGNSINVVQTITVNDVTPPTATAPANVTVECPGDVPVADPLQITDEADNCTTNPVVVFVSDISDGNTCPEVITRTYSITDDCGNVTTVEQTIIINDVTPPTASNPPSINQSGGVAPAPDVSVVTDEADNCTANPVVAFVSDVSDGNACPETITRTYSVTDECGNTVDVVQLIFVGDLPPSGTAPADVTVECFSDVPNPDPLLITDETDNTGPPVVAFVSDVSDGNTCPEVITRIYSITDDCGNIVYVDHTITVNDVTNPTGTAPADVTVECIDDVPQADPAQILDEADNCTLNPVVEFVSDVSDGNTCPEVITRTYSITDDCGNSIDVVQTITINDVTPPTATAPANVTVECPGDVPAVDPLQITDEADNCTMNPIVAFVSDVSDGNTCPEVITRTYSITDDCGNVTNVEQTITINDVTPPTASNPPSINQSGGVAPAPDISVVTDEADNCTVNPLVEFVSDVSDGNACPETITRTYSVTDECGNTVDVVQLIFVGDLPPSGTAPADVTVECFSDVPNPDPLLITDETDNSGPPVVAFVSDVSDGNTCPEVITRTYSITDDCGNIVYVDHTITINDVTNPTGTAPADVAVECIDDVPQADPLQITDEADNCTLNPVVEFVSDVSDGNTCPEVITRTYSITDDCGNSINVVQTITVNDVTPPTATAPANVTVECPGDVPAADPLQITDEVDNCSTNPIVAFVSDVSDGNTCPEVITRTYSITDDCGNTINVEQTITINDVTLPTGTAPANVTVECIDDVPQADPLQITDEADNCTVNPVVAFVSDVSDGNTCPEVITRTYSITDDCGNVRMLTQEITVDDVTSPTASNPEDIFVNCASDVPVPDISVVTDEMDNCGVPVVAFVSDISDGNTCNNEIITRTYSITDNCGNTINVTQNIHIGAYVPEVYAGIDQSVCEGTMVAVSANCSSEAQMFWDQGVTDGEMMSLPVGSSTYTVTADICNGECVNDDEVNIIVNPNPVVLFEADTLVGCEPFLVQFTNLSTEQYDCEWNFDGTMINGCDDQAFVFENPGLYDVGLTVTSSAGCTSSLMYTDYIEVVSFPEASFSASATTLTIEDTEVDFTNSSTNADEYLWSFGDYSGASTEVNPTHTYPVDKGRVYNVTLWASNYLGCTDSTTLPITIEDVLIFYVPNSFTPDDDEFNQVFLPIFSSGLDIYNYHMTIFNRWGEIVFESYDVKYGWDGDYANRGIVQDGTYVWKLEFGETMSDKTHIYHGHVNIIK